MPQINSSAVSPTLTITVDTVAAAPSIPVLDSTRDSGTLGDGITKFTQPKFNGTAEAGSLLASGSDLLRIGAFQSLERVVDGHPQSAQINPDENH